jgi:simple sugar transport system permease protein
MYVFLWKTPLGYQIRVIGHNPKAGRYAGINRFFITVLNLGLAGAIAAIGGAVQILGIQHRLLANFSPGYGYKGIAVALLGRNNPFGVLIAAIFLAALETGSRGMESYTGVSFYLIDAIEALILIFILSSDYLAGRYLFKKEI